MPEQLLRTSEQVTAEQMAAAEDFIKNHIHVQKSEDDYFRDTVREWYQTYPEHHCPMWLRRTLEMGAEFGAAIDYCIVLPETERRVFASLVIDQDEVEVWLPRGESAENPHEPYTASTRPYTVMSIALAMTEIEAAVQPQLGS